ncbi:MAG: quinone-dependent dihydroorotate dehydrogenase [Proteobacteria bacterium]|nr:quinone-dependent dihydroorotate dehydrogenase [Pseudomonadota bacterium]
MSKTVVKKTWLRLRSISWIQFFGDLLSRALGFLPPETAHNMSLRILASNKVTQILPGIPLYNKDFTVHVPGLGSLIHPIGLAAGYDKNAVAIAGLYRLGFSLIEIGTVTPRPQLGHKKPRVFRRKDTHDLVNRMGFPNRGVTEVVSRLKEHGDRSFLLGINIGKNQDTPSEKAMDDYLYGLEHMKAYGDYFVLNVSSPNTAGLRELATPKFFQRLSERIREIEAGLTGKVWVKLDPDLDQQSFQGNIEGICQGDFAGVILTNTARVIYPEPGGLSGHSLRSQSLRRLIWATDVTGGRLPIMAVGGIMSGSDVIESLRLGASCVQLYTALVYRGPWLVHKILSEIEWCMDDLGIHHLSEVQHLRLSDVRGVSRQ